MPSLMDECCISISLPHLHSDRLESKSCLPRDETDFERYFRRDGFQAQESGDRFKLLIARMDLDSPYLPQVSYFEEWQVFKVSKFRFREHAAGTFYNLETWQLLSIDILVNRRSHDYIQLM